MGTQQKIIGYLSINGKAHKYKIARQLKIGVMEVTRALSNMEKMGLITLKEGSAILLKRKKPLEKK